MTDGFGQIGPGDEPQAEARLVFEVANVALALPLTAVSRILSSRPIRTIPHRSREGILGIVNVDGDLRLCASLAEVCALPGADRDRARSAPRLIVIGTGQRAWVAPVDTVTGVAEILEDEGDEPPAQGDPTAAL